MRRCDHVDVKGCVGWQSSGRVDPPWLTVSLAADVVKWSETQEEESRLVSMRIYEEQGYI